ncbi:cysteine desulfurase [Mycobacterium sp.]|uniref:aminotransferase class V-fold PLP-dependent enzyme n=1 Tax=Mycobacterium sp. TaxID=1785 RepID=UPI002C8B84AA|nr:cysteine desulfurase [Mycobacterium sp.]HTY35362.1 cysteine desulfurase [Mycobacterium sp.]
MQQAAIRPTAAGPLGASIHGDFPILARSDDGVELAYLDNAATSHKPRPVLHAMTNYYATTNSNVGRGYYRLSMQSADCYQDSRVVIQTAIGATDPAEIVFTKSATEAINLLADTLGRQYVGAEDRVVVTTMEHNSNLLPWRRLCERVGAKLVVIPVDRSGNVDLARFREEIRDDVKIAAFSHVSNVLGTVNPVREMAAAAHEHGTIVVVDGAQAVPHFPVNVGELGVDFYCFSGHKAYGPMGIGVLYARRELLCTLAPYQVGGGTVKAVSFQEPVDYVPAPERLEAGTPNVAGAVGLAAAMQYLDKLGWRAIREHDERLVHGLLEAVADLDRVHVVGAPAEDASGIVSIIVDGIHPYDVGGHFDSLGIAVRCGVHCASMLLDALGLLGTVRISFGVYNTELEIDRVRDALATVKPGIWTSDHPTTRFL